MWEMSTMERRYSVPPSTLSDPSGRYRTTEDLHAWSIYRQNLNSDFTDSALGKFIFVTLPKNRAEFYSPKLLSTIDSCHVHLR